MAHSTKVYSKEQADSWRELLEACSKAYRITNRSDYSGVEYLIEWDESED